MDQAPAAQALEDVEGTGAQIPTKVGSSERVVTPLAVAPSRPVPAPRFVMLWNARQSVAPLASQVPLVAVQVKSGIELAGKAVTPEVARQPEAQLTVIL